jgi:hypothetical protein
MPGKSDTLHATLRDLGANDDDDQDHEEARCIEDFSPLACDNAAP